MGYRSEVIYAIQPTRNEESLEKWFVFLAEARNCPTTQHAMSMIDQSGEYEAMKESDLWWRGGMDSDNNAILIEFDNVKWYDSFDEVQSFTALMDMIGKDYEDYIHAAYIRIGEEEGDVETRYENEGYELARVVSYYQIESTNFDTADRHRRNVSTKPKQEEVSNDEL